jgi:CubicO group peptidase (beta-lactamase class C family)
MVDSGYFRSDALPAGAALGYERIDGEWRTDVFHLPVRGSGDGGLYSTTGDIHRFWVALMAGRIVPDAVVTLMTRPSSPADAGGEAYGLGFWLRPSADAVIVEGQGAGVSFRSVHVPSTTTHRHLDDKWWRMASVAGTGRPAVDAVRPQ